jgi:sensor c-di-GMP phosphodiesterase-like protein
METELWEKMRAIRRRHRERMILRRKSRVDMGRWHVKNFGYLAKNNTVCSCWMCGNPRKFFGEVTAQERKFKQAYQRGDSGSNREIYLEALEWLHRIIFVLIHTQCTIAMSYFRVSGAGAFTA